MNEDVEQVLQQLLSMLRMTAVQDAEARAYATRVVGELLDGATPRAESAVRPVVAELRQGANRLEALVCEADERPILALLEAQTAAQTMLRAAAWLEEHRQ